MISNHKIAITVFTPTYNRAHTLHRVYESLCQQSVKSFEWLIIDDGSSDNTKNLVEKWQKEENMFPIRYIFQPKSGKHFAINLSVKEAKGEYWVPVDSDDSIDANSIEEILHDWEQIEINTMIAGIGYLGKDKNGVIKQAELGQASIDLRFQEIYLKYKLLGDKWFAWKRDILLLYPFPEITGYNFVPESVVWYKIGKTYNVRLFNKALYNIHFDGDDRITTSTNSIKNPYLTLLYTQLHLNDNLDLFRYNFPLFIKLAGHHSRYSLHYGKNVTFEIQNNWGKFLIYLMLPFGFILFLIDKIKQNVFKQ